VLTAHLLPEKARELEDVGGLVPVDREEEEVQPLHAELGQEAREALHVGASV
jgi:hypothetical protein